MVFLFGYDVPIVEVLVAISLMVLIALFMLLISLRRTSEMNRKLDAILAEEKKVKKELDITKLEEDQQLTMMRHVVKELHALTGISHQEREGMAAVERLASNAAKRYGGKASPELRAALHQLQQEIERLRKVSSQEDTQLAKLRMLITRARR